MAAFSHDGLWWDASDPGQKWTGTLLFDRRRGTSLKVVVPVETPEFAPRTRMYDLIHGIASSGKPFTLIDCYDVSTRGSLFGVPRPVGIRANQLIAGLHCDTADPLLSSVSLSFLHINDWWSRSGVEIDSTVKHPCFAARYQATEPVLLYDAEPFRVVIRPWPQTSVARHAASLRERISIEISSAEPMPFSAFQRLARACGDFLSICCLTHCDVEGFTLVPPKEEGVVRRTGTYHAVPFHKSREQRSSVLGHMLVNFGEIEGRAQELFGAWLSKIDQLQDARTLYLSGVYGGGYIEHRLLALTQAAEALHRRFFQDRYMEQAAFDAEVLEPLVKAIPVEAVGPLRQGLRDRLKFANEHSLRKRLRTLFETHESVLTALVDKPKELVSAIVDTRNEFTHFPIPEAELSPPYSRPRADRVLQFNWVLRLLLESCFLQAMGFEIAEIESFVRRSETYRQMGVRFRTGALETQRAAEGTASPEN